MKKGIILTIILMTMLAVNVHADKINISYETAEGSGFDSPEEAVSAYIQGWKNSDYAWMMAAFAVETYAANYDLNGTVERVGAYTPIMEFIPGISELSDEINIETRRSRISKIIKAHYLLLTQSKSMESTYAGTYRMLEDNETAEEMMADMFATDDSTYLSDITTDGVFIDPASLNEAYSSETNQAAIAKTAELAGADEVCSLLTTIRSAGAFYLLSMDTVRYGDRWYILEAGGNIGNLLGIPSDYMGLLPISEDVFTEWMETGTVEM